MHIIYIIICVPIEPIHIIKIYNNIYIKPTGAVTATKPNSKYSNGNIIPVSTSMYRKPQFVAIVSIL